jgi:nucleotide-binding universal stress UspA family protein
VFERIVIGYASDQAGRDALVLGAGLAALAGAAATIVFPYNPLFAAVPGDAAEEQVREEVAALTAGLWGAVAPTYHWTPSSWPIRGLHEMAAYEGAGLMVFGAAREEAAGRPHVSLMERIVHGAPCAVAVAPAHYADPPPRNLARVGVGFSASEEGMRALRLAHELAARAGGQLRAIAGAGLDPELASYASGSPDLPEAERQVFAQTEAALERATAELGDEAPISHETIGGDPSDVLIERSSELDILVLGSRAYGPVRYALLGSVSCRVMREAHCPVLVLPRGAHDGEAGAAGQESAAD